MNQEFNHAAVEIIPYFYIFVLVLQ